MVPTQQFGYKFNNYNSSNNTKPHKTFTKSTNEFFFIYGDHNCFFDNIHYVTFDFLGIEFSFKKTFR